MNSVKTCFVASNVKAIPTAPHFAVLVNRSFTYDDGYGDRGSRSTSTHTYIEYIVCMTEKDLNDWVTENDKPKYGAPPVYRVIYVNAVKIKKHVSFEYETTNGLQGHF